MFNSTGEVIGIAVATIQEGQNLNFAVPIDYAKGMLLSDRPQTLASVYEPQPEAKGAHETAPAGSQKTVTPAPAAQASIPDEMKEQRFAYLEKKMGVWTEQDARGVLGDPVRHRFGYDAHNVPFWDINAYADPTRLFRQFELAFDRNTTKLETIYAYPWDMTWEQCRKLWGDNARKMKNPDGTRFYSYRDRRINVLLSEQGKVINLGIYSAAY